MSDAYYSNQTGSPEKKSGDKYEYKRLLNAVDASRRNLQKARRQQVMAVRQFVGAHYIDAEGSSSSDYYGDAGTVAGRKDGSGATPINFMHIIVDTLTTFISARRPKTQVTTKQGTAKIAADRLQIAINHLLDEIKVEKTFQQVATDAMFSMGIVKTGIWPANKLDFETEVKNIGQPYCESIQFDNFVYDTNAKDFEECSFVGHTYRVPLEYVKESGLFIKDRVKDLKPMDKGTTDELGDDKLDTVGTDFTRTGNTTEYKDFIELIDLYLPFERKTLTFVHESRSSQPVSCEPIKEEDWEGPEGGPYTYLIFGQPPGNIRPLPPAFQWMDMHNFLNNIFRKIERQARRQKNIGVTNDPDAADRIRSASDGEVVDARPDSVQEVRLGGPDQQLYAVLLGFKDLLLGALSGNVEALAGLGQLTETAKQDKMIRESASIRVNKMQDAMMSFATEVVGKLAWYLFYDPMIDLPATKRLPNTGIEIPIRITDMDMEGDFLDYNFQLEPYSMQYQSPLERDQTMMRVLNETVFPLMQVLQQQGLFIDFKRLLEIRAENLNVPELSEIITSAEPDDLQQPFGEAPQKIQPLIQRSESIRSSVPTGGTTQSRDAALIQTLMGGGVNQDQQASLARGRAT